MRTRQMVQLGRTVFLGPFLRRVQKLFYSNFLSDIRSCNDHDNQLSPSFDKTDVMTLHIASGRRPLTVFKSAVRSTRRQPLQTRSVSAGTLRYREPPPPPPRDNPWASVEARSMLVLGGTRD